MMKFALRFVILIVLLVITACSPSTTVVVAPTQSPTIPGQDGYPAPGDLNVGSYPAPNETIVTQLPPGVLPESPKEAPEPSSGTASISGVLFSHTINQVLPKTMFYLLPIDGPGVENIPPIIVSPDPEKGDIVSISDEKGMFNISNVPPGTYILVVWAPMSWSVAQVSTSDETPLFLELKEGDRQPLNVIYLSWP